MRRLTVDMQALIDALTMPEDVPWHSFLDLRDGSILEVDLEDAEEPAGGVDSSVVASDPERYVALPRIESQDEYAIMAAFAASVEDDDLHERLGDALHGRGAFSRFRRVVDRYPELRERWFAFRRDELTQYARRWLASLDVEPLYEVVDDAKPSAADAPATRDIGLVDLLLLGAPEGKTELLEGRVLRQIRARTAPEARSIFTRVARELCCYFDEPWRKRYVEGKTAFEIERAHLDFDRDVVQLWVDVPKSTWKAFG